MSTLPPLPEKIRTKITKREYIDFNDLLSDNMYPHPSHASSQNNFTLSVDPQDGDSLSFVRSQRRKRRIDGLSSWLEAWNVFLRSTLSLYPHLAPDLLAYQDQICKYSRKFKSAAWLMYDTAFRFMAATNTNMPWAKGNEQLASNVGIPLAPNKLEGPTTRLTFLGILIDSSCMETSLPDDKLQALLTELHSWSSRNKCLKRELLSLIGKLNFACRIIPAGRIFLRRLIDLSTSARLPHHHVTMNREARRDITWWLQFLPTWNGRAIIPEPHWTKSPDLELFTDASGSLGFGIFYMGHWISEPWPPQLQDRSIQWKELYPIAIACLIWGQQWSGKKLLFHCDNQAVVDIWASGTSRDPLIMHLVRSIFFSAATHHYTVLVTHIAGTNNSVADSLSRLQITLFRHLAPTADVEQTPVPKSALTLWHID